MYLSELVRVYVRERAANGQLCPKNSAPGARRILLRFVDQAAVAPHQLTRGHVEAFLARPVGPNTRRKDFSTIRAFCQWLVNRGHLDFDPTAGMKAPRAPRAVPRGYRRDVVDGLLRVAPDARGRLIVLLEVQEGLRACEVARAELGDLDVEERTLLVHGKGLKERLLPVSEQTWATLEAYLREWPAKAGPLIRSYTRPWTGVSADYIADLVQAWLRLVGVPCGGGHGLRHTMATTLLRECGADIRDVQMALGHASLSSTSVYLPYSDAKRLRAVMGGRRYGSSHGAAVPKGQS